MNENMWRLIVHPISQDTDRAEMMDKLLELDAGGYVIVSQNTDVVGNELMMTTVATTSKKYKNGKRC